VICQAEVIAAAGPDCQVAAGLAILIELAGRVADLTGLASRPARSFSVVSGTAGLSG
jgi:hypothetical protein